MKFSIVVEDNAVIVDGVRASIDLAALTADDIRAVQWNNGTGHIEMVNGANVPLVEAGLSAFEDVLDAHAAATAPPPPPTLAELKVIRRREFNTLREATFAEGVEFNGKMVDSDATSVQKINGAVTMALIAISAAQAFNIDWTCQDDTTISLDAAGMIGLGVTVGTYADTLHQRTRVAKVALDVAETIEAVNAVVW